MFDKTNQHKQVAEQFIELFDNIELYDDWTLGPKGKKQCVQILLDQLIQNYEFDCIAQTIGKFDPMDKLNFYDNVKTELNKL